MEPAEYGPTVLKELPRGQRCTIYHVADFVVDFINNDLLGVISQTVGIFQITFLTTLPIYSPFYWHVEPDHS